MTERGSDQSTLTCQVITRAVKDDPDNTCCPWKPQMDVEREGMRNEGEEWGREQDDWKGKRYKNYNFFSFIFRTRKMILRGHGREETQGWEIRKKRTRGVKGREENKERRERRKHGGQKKKSEIYKSEKGRRKENNEKCENQVQYHLLIWEAKGRGTGRQ